MQGHSLWWKPKVYSTETNVRPIIINSLPTPWLVYMYANTNLHGLIDPNSPVLIGQNYRVLIVDYGVAWLVRKDANKDKVEQFWLDSSGLSQLVEVQYQ